MDIVVRSAAVYVVLVVVFRVAGKRTLNDITTFDVILLLVISEGTQQALLGEDFSLTAAFLVITTLVGLEILFSLVQNRWPMFDHAIDSRPNVVVVNGEVLEKRMRRHRISEADVLESARESQGLERLDQVKYAVLERSGRISIVPRRDQGS